MTTTVVGSLPVELSPSLAEKVFHDVEDKLDFGHTYIWEDFQGIGGIPRPPMDSQDFTDWVWNFWIPFRDVALENGLFLSERGVDEGFRILEKEECGEHVKKFMHRCLKSIRKKINGLQNIDVSDMIAEQRTKLENEEKRAVWVAELTGALLRKRKLPGPSSPESVRKMLQ
jgi:hypothetical protein